MKQKTALDILKLGKNVFITGAAGTGKTHLLNEFVEYLREKDVKPTIVAPTGIAASHLGGQTIHSFFSLGIKEIVDDFFLDQLKVKKFVREKFAKLDILIIDEISMVSPELFGTMDLVLKTFKDPFLPFGGVQVILSGDFFQLPPISKKPKEKRFAWQSPIWKELEFHTCYLQEKFRQNDDKLINILDDIRGGFISEQSRTALELTKNREFDYTPTRLYTHNFDVDRVNNLELAKLDGEPTVFEKESKGSKRYVDKIFSTSLVIEELSLKEGAVVIFIKNNPAKGYVNGTTGVVKGFTKKSGLPIVITSSGVSIIADYDDWSIVSDTGVSLATVSQIPLRLAWAITIHKSQGMSLDSAEIDLTKTFEVGQGYVALSRVKSIDGLKVLGFNEKALQIDSLILKVDDRIKIASDRAKDEVEKISKTELKKQFAKYIKEVKSRNLENDRKSKKR